MSASSNAFFTAISGIPPKAKAETRTPVSMTILFLFFVGLSPYCFYRIFDILHCQFCTLERLSCYLESSIKPFFRRKNRKDIIFRINLLYRCNPHIKHLLYCFVFYCKLKLLFFLIFTLTLPPHAVFDVIVDNEEWFLAY